MPAHAARKGSKPPSGLKRGFLYSASQPKTAIRQQLGKASTPIQHTGFANSTAAPTPTCCPTASNQEAFTGNITEHVGSQAIGGPPELSVKQNVDTGINAGKPLISTPASGPSADGALPKRMSKFKLARSAQ